MYYKFCICPAKCGQALYAGLVCIYCGTDLMIDDDEDDDVIFCSEMLIGKIYFLV